MSRSGLTTLSDHRTKKPSFARHNAPIAKAAYAFFKRLCASPADDYYILVACSKTKQALRDKAANVYSSPLFRKSIKIAVDFGIDYSIVSAKYGLLNPENIIECYDETLRGRPTEFLRTWALEVSASIRRSIGPNKKILFLAGKSYADPISKFAPDLCSQMEFPLESLSLGNRLSFLNYISRLERRRSDVALAYHLFGRAAEKQGLSTLKDTLRKKLPERGVYFFFDPSERTFFSEGMPRLVRVGTHGVSLGSKASLRSRLRAHLGNADGSGNHRTSVFRLHVGRALIIRDDLAEDFPDWGRGQVSDAAIKIAERSLEIAVSDYISNLMVLYIQIDDHSSKSSLRALLETQFIALFTEENQALDISSNSWLGRQSDKKAIRESGLWNVRDVGSRYSERFISFAEQIWEKTIG